MVNGGVLHIVHYTEFEAVWSISCEHSVQYRGGSLPFTPTHHQMQHTQHVTMNPNIGTQYHAPRMLHSIPTHHLPDPTSVDPPFCM